MKTSYQEGKILDYTNPSSSAVVESGTVIALGNRIGIVQGEIEASGKGSLVIEGVHILAKKAATAFTAGQPVFWDADPGELTDLAADGVFAGYVPYAAGSSDATAYVLLVSPPLVMPVQAAVATADGSDAATTQALANALKVAHNALLVKLKAAGIMLSA